MGWKINPKTGESEWTIDDTPASLMDLGTADTSQYGIKVPTSGTYKLLKDTNGNYKTDFWNTDEWSKFAADGGTVGNDGELIYGSGVKPSGNSTGLFGLGTTGQWDTAMGLGGLAMKAIALPQQMEYYGAQTDLAKQQLASNKQAMADRQTFNNTWANASNGLAGRSFTGAAGYGTGTIGSTNPVLK